METSAGILSVLIGFGFLIVFPIFWMGIIWLLAQFSGWAQLADYYPAKTPFPTNTMHFRSLSLGYFVLLKPGYSNIVRIGVDNTHLYLSVFWLFKIGHKPLQIPFEEMEVRDGWFSFFVTKHVNTLKAPSVTITLTKGLFEKIEARRLAASA